MCSDTFGHFFVRDHEHGPETFVGLEIWETILQHQSGFGQVKRVQENASNWGSREISEERVPLEYVIAEIEIELNIIPEYLVQEDVRTAHTISLIETEHPLTV